MILSGRPVHANRDEQGQDCPTRQGHSRSGRVPYGHDIAPTVDDAIETFRKARKNAPHAGVVKSVLRLFDELVKCDEDGILKDVRKAAEGVE